MIARFAGTTTLVLFLTATIAAGAAGCDRDAPPPAPSPDPGAPLDGAAREPLDGQPGAPSGDDASLIEAEPLLVVDSFPGREELHTFSLTWLGGDTTVSLRAAPHEGAEEIGRASFEDGAEVDWLDTRMLVFAPRIFVANRPTTWHGLPYDPAEADLVPEEVPIVPEERIELGEGDALELLQYGGEGTCYVRIGERLFLGMCPGREFSVEGGVPPGSRRFEPADQQWWVQIEHDDRRGWVRVDGSRFEVRVREITEYE